MINHGHISQGSGLSGQVTFRVKCEARHAAAVSCHVLPEFKDALPKTDQLVRKDKCRNTFDCTDASCHAALQRRDMLHCTDAQMLACQCKHNMRSLGKHNMRSLGKAHRRGAADRGLALQRAHQAGRDAVSPLFMHRPVLQLAESVLLSCSNSPSWPSRSRGPVSVVTHTQARATAC